MSCRASCFAESRGHRDIPEVRVRERCAFYGILLRHEHGQCVAEGQIGRGEGMMIRKGVFDHLQPLGAQFAEEARRVANTGNRMHGALAEGPERPGSFSTVDPPGVTGDQIHTQRCGQRQLRQRGVLGRPVQHYEVGAYERRGRFAQRTGRQQPTVTETAGAVDHDDRTVARQTQVLQSVITQDQLRPACCEHPRPGDTIARHHRRAAAAPGEQKRLIAHFAPARVGAYGARGAVGTTVAAREDADAAPTGAQLLREPQC